MTVDLFKVKQIGFVPSYQRAGILSLDEVHDLLPDWEVVDVYLPVIKYASRYDRGQNINRSVEVFHGHEIYMDSSRYRLFQRDHVCCSCGIAGAYYAVERNTKWSRRQKRPLIAEGQHWHLNLYAVRNGVEVMMTKDHHIPRSRGGADHDSNYVPMCSTCNKLKSNRLPGESDEEYEAFLLARGGLTQSKEQRKQEQLKRGREALALANLCSEGTMDL